MAFAYPSQLAARLGVTLTSAQEEQAEAALDAATALVAAELDATEDDIDPVPDVIKHTTITVALRIYSNPTGAANSSERLGEFQHSAGYAREGSPELTKTESLIVRRAWFGRTSGSSRPEGNVEEVYDYLYS